MADTLSQYLRNIHRGNSVAFAVLTILLACKCYFFADTVLGHTYYASNWAPWAQFLSIVAASMFMASVVYWGNKVLSTIIVVLLDCWMVANILYFRANALFISSQVIGLVGNLGGFADSIEALLDWRVFALPALSLLAVPLLWIRQKRNMLKMTIVLVVAVGCSLWSSYARSKFIREELHSEAKADISWYNPFAMPEPLQPEIFQRERTNTVYLQTHNPLSLLCKVVYDHVVTVCTRSQEVEWSAEEQSVLSSCMKNPCAPSPVKGHLLLIVCESLENWPIDMCTADGKAICPNMRRWISERNALYVRNVHRQIKYGMSGDGHLIINTGLLPLCEGIACVSYGDNTYPNIAHFYPDSYVISPCRNTWNSSVTTSSYGYKNTIQPQTDNMYIWNDSILMDEARKCLANAKDYACVEVLTISGHMPFDHVEDQGLKLAEDIPHLFRDYLQTAYYTDRQIGRLIQWADTAQCMNNATIVITADHSIFYAWQNETVYEFGNRYDLPFANAISTSPLIILSPAIRSRRVIDEAYQMDIYPTVLGLIGEGSYYWQGLGINLMQDGERTISEPVAQKISDKLIRSNYFANIEQ